MPKPKPIPPALLQIEIPADVKEDIMSVMDTLLGKFAFNIKKIILYGSYAKNRYQPDSDVDIAVVLITMPEKKERRNYTQAVDLERDIDLLFCSEMQLESNKMVYRSINERGVLLYEQL